MVNTRRPFTSIFSVILLLPLYLSAQDDNGQKNWEVAVEQEGITVYTRDVNGSSMKATKSVLTIDVGKEDVAEALKDVESQHEWMATIIESRMLDQISRNEYYAYYKADAPWPVSQRDIVSHYKVKEKSSGEILFNVKGAPDYIDEKEGIVRIQNATSLWRILPQKGKSVKVIYRYHAEPGGSIPSWLANQAVTDTPFNTVKNLRERLEE
jgi:hypothetical protein